MTTFNTTAVEAKNNVVTLMIMTCVVVGLSPVLFIANVGVLFCVLDFTFKSIEYMQESIIYRDSKLVGTLL
jgi:hypothetical protein